MARRIFNGFLTLTGYILSPLSWWNDLVVNIPLAYVFSCPFALLGEQFFLPAFIFGYWLTNLAGLVLLHRGISGLLNKEGRKHSWLKDVVISMAYTIIIILIVITGLIKSPGFLTSHEHPQG